MVDSREMVVRLGVAALLGALVGTERERRERAAGMRTHAMVALGACLMMLVSAFGFNDALRADHTVVLDPSRVAAQVVSGIGFLGAGAIILRKDTVRGLTTAASIWVVAGLGLAIGGGMYLPAIAASVFILLILIAMRRVEGWLFQHRRIRRVTVFLRQGSGTLAPVEQALTAVGATVQMVRLRPGGAGGRDCLDLELGAIEAQRWQLLLEQLRTVPGVLSVTFDLRSTLTPSDAIVETSAQETSGGEDVE